MSSDSQTASVIQDGREGWGRIPFVYTCPKCKSALLTSVETNQRVCPVCYGAELTHQEAYAIQASPELALPFSVDRSQLQTLLGNWASGPWLLVPDLKADALLGRATRIFIPMWLVDGQVSGVWQAQAGYEYQVASSRDAFDNGQWTSHQVHETRLRWEPRLGTIQRPYENLTVQALEAQDRLAPLVGTFPIQNGKPYQPGFVEGAFVLLPDIPVENAFPLAKTQFDRAAGEDCRKASGAQRVEQIGLRCEYQELHWTLLLMPIYSSYYQEEDGTLRPVVINGATGQVTGVKRVSQSKGWKWTGGLAALAAICILAAVLIGLLGAVLPPVVFISGLLFFLGVVLGLASPIPAIWAWQYNRRTD